MKAKVTSLYDEGSLESTALIGAEGFSVLIEVDDIKVMFDTGMRGKYLLGNMMQLEVDADSITEVVISNGGKEYCGGLNDLLKERQSPLRISYPCSAEREKGIFGHGIKIRPENSDKALLHPTDDWNRISEHLFMSSSMDTGGQRRESFMVLITKKGPVVIASRSECGVATIMDFVKERFGTLPCAYIGGVLLGKKRPPAVIAAEEFSSRGCKELYLNHCTGVPGMMHLRMELGKSGVNDFYVGSERTFEL